MEGSGLLAFVLLRRSNPQGCLVYAPPLKHSSCTAVDDIYPASPIIRVRIGNAGFRSSTVPLPPPRNTHYSDLNPEP